MQITRHEIHIWAAKLESNPDLENKQISLLSGDEKERANRFKFAIHRHRFIAARSILRCILSKYLSVLAEEIQFAYTNKKPHLQFPSDTGLEFNLSHSADMAVYALTLNHAIGIDIEKMESTFNEAIAKRYFSDKENHSFEKLSAAEQIIAFYRLWSRKEAMIKACGKGLSISLSSFSVSVHDIEERVYLENQYWTLIPLQVAPGYQSAVATNQKIDKVSFWNFSDDDPLR